MKAETKNGQGDTRVRLGEIPLESRYTAGLGGQLFFKALKERGEFLATRCKPCKQVYVPARQFCERCFGELNDTVTLKPEGILRSFTLAYYDRDGHHLEWPQVLGAVQLDGATTVLIHRLLGSRGSEQPLAIGSRVRAVLKPKAKRAGSILDIEGFELL